MKRLGFEFYNRNVVEVAKDLLGKTFCFKGAQGIITEVEAYRGLDDEASHAYRGRTKRASIMYGPPGISYFYFIYGMYYCFNIVTEEEHNPSAVLIRGIKLPQIHLNGPGKICRYFNITKEHNGINLTTSEELYVTEGILVNEHKTSCRIGIKKATDKQWRFFIENLKILD